MKYKFKLSAMVELGIGMVVAASLLLAGCGGGGGGSGGSAPAASTLSGVAAVGAPIVAGTINISCAAGSALAPTTTSSMGAWQVTLSGQTLPCAVQVSGGTINAVANTLLYHSIATAPGTVNVTPLTELMVANLTGTATPSIWFTGLNSTPTPLTAITQTQVNTALTNLRTALSGLTPLSTINPITTAFTPTSGNVSDDMLVALKVAMANTGVTYTALLSNASVPAFTAPVTGFGTALTTAYAGTTSGGTPTPTCTLPQVLTNGVCVTPSTGVTFSGTLGGFNSVANTSVSNGVFVAGGETITTGSNYVWSGANGAVASLGYNSINNTIVVILPGVIYGTGCGVSSTVIVGMQTYPLCSSVGITFNRAAGIITFASTPLLYGPVQPGLSPPTGITATGSLSFSPF